MNWIVNYLIIGCLYGLFMNTIFIIKKREELNNINDKDVRLGLFIGFFINLAVYTILWTFDIVLQILAIIFPKFKDWLKS